MRYLASILWLLVACDPSTEEQDVVLISFDDCTSLTYDNYGEGFLRSWCSGCHAAAVVGDRRQGAPPSITFDSADDVRTHLERVLARATGDGASMPPVGGDSAEERARFAEWLRCGAL